MLESDFEEVRFLMGLKKKLNTQLNKCEELKDMYVGEVDRGGIEGFNKGYNCFIHTFSDGSGQGLDMSGCYVGEEVADAVKNVLLNQLERVQSRLTELRVVLE